jgi:CRP-like cAMP-binding protein
MAVAEGYKLETDSQTDVAAAFSMRERLRASLLRQHGRYTTYTLPAGDEILPLYDARMRFYFVESGKLRLYNLLPNEPTITLSILSENDVFLQWRRIATFRACAPWR